MEEAIGTSTPSLLAIPLAFIVGFALKRGSASVAVEFLDNNHIARLDPVLLSAGLDHRVHLEASA